MQRDGLSHAHSSRSGSGDDFFQRQCLDDFAQTIRFGSRVSVGTLCRFILCRSGGFVCNLLLIADRDWRDLFARCRWRGGNATRRERDRVN